MLRILTYSVFEKTRVTTYEADERDKNSNYIWKVESDLRKKVGQPINPLEYFIIIMTPGSSTSLHDIYYLYIPMISCKREGQTKSQKPAMGCLVVKLYWYPTTTNICVKQGLR